MLEKARRIALYENPPGTTADSVGDAGGDVNRRAAPAPPRPALPCPALPWDILSPAQARPRALTAV